MTAGAVLATMASRGSALRRQLESLLDDAPHRRRRVGPWLAVTTVAVPAVCLAPVVGSRASRAFPRLRSGWWETAPAPEAPAARGVPSPGGVDARPAARKSTTAAAAPPSAAAAQSTRGSRDPTRRATTRRDAGTDPLRGGSLSPSRALRPRRPVFETRLPQLSIAPGPAPSRTRFDEPDLQRRVLNWVRGQRVILSFDPQRPKWNAPTQARLLHV